jgi:hypothetical protein
MLVFVLPWAVDEEATAEVAENKRCREPGKAVTGARRQRAAINELRIVMVDGRILSAEEALSLYYSLSTTGRESRVVVERGDRAEGCASGL